MAEVIKLRRGLSTRKNNIIPLEGELLYCTDTKEVYVGDGVTPGGVPVAFAGAKAKSYKAALASNFSTTTTGTAVDVTGMTLEITPERDGLLVATADMTLYKSAGTVPDNVYTRVTVLCDGVDIEHRRAGESVAGLTKVAHMLPFATTPVYAGKKYTVKVSIIQGQTGTLLAEMGTENYQTLTAILYENPTSLPGPAFAGAKVTRFQGAQSTAPYAMSNTSYAVVPGCEFDITPTRDGILQLTGYMTAANQSSTSGSSAYAMIVVEQPAGGPQILDLRQSAWVDAGGASEGLTITGALEVEAGATYHASLRFMSGGNVFNIGAGSTGAKLTGLLFENPATIPTPEYVGSKATRFQAGLGQAFNTTTAGAFVTVPDTTININCTRDGSVEVSAHAGMFSSVANEMTLRVVAIDENGKIVMDSQAPGYQATPNGNVTLALAGSFDAQAGKSYTVAMQVYQASAGTLTLNSGVYNKIVAVLYENPTTFAPDPYVGTKVTRYESRVQNAFQTTTAGAYVPTGHSLQITPTRDGILDVESAVTAYKSAVDKLLYWTYVSCDGATVLSLKQGINVAANESAGFNVSGSLPVTAGKTYVVTVAIYQPAAGTITVEPYEFNYLKAILYENPSSMPPDPYVGTKVTRFQAQQTTALSSTVVQTYVDIPGMTFTVTPTRDGILFVDAPLSVSMSAANGYAWSQVLVMEGATMVGQFAAASYQAVAGGNVTLAQSGSVAVSAGRSYVVKVQMMQRQAGTLSMSTGSYATLTGILYENANSMPDPLFVQPGGRVISCDWTKINTTATVTGLVESAASMSVAPQLAVNLAAGHKVLIQAHAIASVSIDQNIYARIMRSGDGGVTWASVGTYAGAAPGASRNTNLAVDGMDSPGAGSYIYGLSVGNGSGGSATVTLSYRGITVTVVDPSTYTPTNMVETGSNQYGEYRKYPDGVLECWGTVGPLVTGVWTTFNLPVPFANTDYVLSVTPFSGSVSPASSLYASPVTTSTFKMYFVSTSQEKAGWRAIGHWK